MTLYTFLKFLHIAGVVVFLGDIIVTAIWKWLADRTGDTAVAAYAQKLVLFTDKFLMIPAIAVLVASGYIKAHMLQIPVWTNPSMLTAQILFFIAGGIWGVVLRPIQMRQMVMANGFRAGDGLSPEYLQLTKRWLVWGWVAIILPVGSMFLMINR